MTKKEWEDNYDDIAKNTIESRKDIDVTPETWWRVRKYALEFIKQIDELTDVYFSDNQRK